MSEAESVWRPRRGDDASAPVDLSRLAEGTPIDRWKVAVSGRTASRLAEGVGAGSHESRGEAIVTPALAGNLGVGLSFRVLPRNILHTAQVIGVHGTVRAGDELIVRGHVERVLRRRAKAFVSVAARIDVGDHPVWSITTESYVPGMPADRLDDEGDGPPEAPAGPAIAADLWAPSLAEMAAFSGPGNFHSDPGIAEKFGFPRPVVQGMQLAARAMHVFPGIAAVGREMRMWFTGVTLQDDSVSFSLRGDEAGELWVVATGEDARERLVLRSIGRPASSATPGPEPIESA